MRAISVRKVEEKAPPTSVQHARKPKKQFSECCCREVFVFVRAIVARCHAHLQKALEKATRNEAQAGQTTKNQFPHTGVGKICFGTHGTFGFNAGDKSQKSRGKGAADKRATCKETQKTIFRMLL